MVVQREVRIVLAYWYLHRRHLVRLWLRDPEYAWKTPAVLQERWDRVYKGVTPEATVFPLEPFVRNASKGGKNGAVSGIKG